MAGHKLLAFRSKKETQDGSHTTADSYQHDDEELPVSFSPNDHVPLSPGNVVSAQSLSQAESESFFNSFRSSRTASVYSLSRLSLSDQLSQLTSLSLPDADSLSTSISSIPTAGFAARILANAADQIRAWLAKAEEVLKGLDAEDDAEWAAAGGREGLEEVDAALGKFEGLIDLYVKAIENLEAREDISSVSAGHQQALVHQMEYNLKNWENIRKSLKNVKMQVEMAMEWEELWNVVLGEIGLEMESLSSLIFEMEEARHKALLSDPILENNSGHLDLQELGTIVEESDKDNVSQRFGLQSPSIATSDSPASPHACIAQDDTRLLALFARMQPLHASISFLPMTLSNFSSRAESILPTACQELESRRATLEKKYKTLEQDAEGLRQELSEDRWVVVFRNVGRQAVKLCDSVERAINKLQELIDVGSQHSNPPLLAKKVGDYEAKKGHVGPSVEKVLGIIEKGVTERLTVNGEILRLHLDLKVRWEGIKNNIKDMDLALDSLNMNKNQQLRDSISSIVSMDRSGTSVGSGVNTPGSSPGSSVVMGPVDGSKRDISPAITASARRGSIGYPSSVRPNGTWRNMTTPSGISGLTSLPRKYAGSHSFTSDKTSRNASPSPYAYQASTTPTTIGRPQRPSLHVDNRPRWNSSSKVDYFEFGSKPRPLPFATPSGRKGPITPSSSTGIPFRHSSGLPLPSPLGRSSPTPSIATATIHHRSRLSSDSQTPTNLRQQSFSSPIQPSNWVKIKEKTPPSVPTTKRQMIDINSTPNAPESPNSPSARPKNPRPSTSMANSHRTSMLPLPKHSPSPLATGRDTVLGHRDPATNLGRQTSLSKEPPRGRQTSMGIRTPSISGLSLKDKRRGS